MGLAYTLYVIGIVLGIAAVVLVIVAASTKDLFYYIPALFAGLISFCCFMVANAEHTEYDKWEDARDWFIEEHNPLILEKIEVNSYYDKHNVVRWYNEDKELCTARIKQGVDDPPWVLFDESCYYESRADDEQS